MSGEKAIGLMRRLRPIILLLVMAGCTHVYEVPGQAETMNRQADRIPLNVELRLSHDLRNAKWEKHVLGDTFLIPLGDNLALNSESLARKLFSDVSVRTEYGDSVGESVDAVLTPRMTAVERTLGLWVWSESILTILLEWSLRDEADNLIWIETIKGEGKGPGGNAFTHKERGKEIIAAAVGDLFRNSFEAISTSPEIRDFSATRDAKQSEAATSEPAS